LRQTGCLAFVAPSRSSGVSSLGSSSLPEVDRDVAAFGDLERAAERVLVAGEVGRHLLRRLEVEVVGVELPARRFLSESPDWMQSSASTLTNP
jgi:hypothetical protein